jgi:hypothetical protein
MEGKSLSEAAIWEPTAMIQIGEKGMANELYKEENETWETIRSSNQHGLRTRLGC